MLKLKKLILGDNNMFFCDVPQKSESKHYLVPQLDENIVL